MVNQNHAHDLGRKRIEVGMIVPVSFLLIYQAKVKLMHERRSLQSSRLRGAANIRGGNATQMRIDDRNEFFKSLR